MNGQILEIIKKLEKIKIFDSILEFISNTLLLIIRKFIRKNSSGNIIIISLHRLGDTVFTIPAVKRVYEHYSNEKVYILTFPDNKDIYNIAFKDESIFPIEKNNFFLGDRIASKKARRILKILHPKIIFDLTGNIASASLIAASKAKEIIGHNTKYYKSIYSTYVPIRHKPHLIDRYLDVVKAYLPIDENKIIREFPIKFQTEGKILIHPFAGWKAKEWNLNKFIELASLLNEEYEVEIVSADNLISEDIIYEVKKHQIPISYTTSINDLVNKIKDCSVFISNDSGPLYIANLLGKATFSIYGPTNPEFSLPFGNYHGFIQKKIPCSPNGTQYCYTNAGLNCPSNECMNLLQVKEVYESLLSFLYRISFHSTRTIS